MRASRLGFDVFLLGVAVLFAALSFGFDTHAGQVPLVAGVLAGGLLLVQIVLDLRAVPEPASAAPASVPAAAGAASDVASGSAEEVTPKSTEAPADAAPQRAEPEWRAPVFTTLALAGFVFLVWLVGYLIAVPVFTFAAMVLLGRTGWKTALAVTAGVGIFVYVLMELVLQANLL